MSVYIVTGASRGLGLEFVKQLSASGKIVFACARNPQGSKDLLNMIDNKNVFGIKMDSTDVGSIEVNKSEKCVDMYLLFPHVGCCQRD
jgi:NAD(P)-dependent dehydrogenase (short-subunit alcohol dehydrogenase family)